MDAFDRDSFETLMSDQPKSVFYQAHILAASPVLSQVYSAFSDLECEFEELEQEIKAYVAQLISLIQTIMSQNENCSVEELFL